jgi:DNA-directed RNA polymerase specialized sigma24 family protein
MTEADEFAELMRAVRRGDAGAAQELWRRFEPMLKREVRLRLRDTRLRQRFDESDVCQSVMASFFVRATSGEYELDTPEQLQRLLAQMGRHKLASQARRHQAECRDARRAEQLPPADALPAGGGASPSQFVAWQELLERFRAALSDEERQLADLRAQGQSWADIAALLGGTADGRRIQLGRAISRVSAELGIDEDNDK